MALEATHIRFALDLKDIYEVRDVNAFVSGSVYPDSRYITGIDRLATHPEDYLKDREFKRNDFRKGWHAHLLCDTVQGDLMKELLPTVKSGDGEEVWIERMAIKILQDIDDVKKFDIVKYLPCLAHVENPNGEDTEKMRGYNRIFQEMYADPARVDITSLYEMWGLFGVGDELRVKVKAKAEAFSADASIMLGVGKLYDAMLLEARSTLQTR